ncbi:MAG: PEGA domain-containing protein [Terriglobales bacterium]
MRLLSAPMIVLCLVACLSHAQDKPEAVPPTDAARVFITDSESWSVAGSSGGSGGNYGGGMAGGARPQTAEIIKTFGERCPQVRVNNIQEKADYIVVLDHEGGKGAFRHKNKVAIFQRISGDSLFSKSTLSLGGSVKDACEAIVQDWQAHGDVMRAAALAAQAKTASPSSAPATPAPVAPPPSVTPSTGKISVASVPDGADIEVDGSFVGNTPSDVQVADGEHTVAVKKAGFKDWERKLKVSAGSNVHLNAALEQSGTP